MAMESPPTQFQVSPLRLFKIFTPPLLRVIPTMTLFCHSFGHLIWKYMAQIYDILFWHSIWHLFWHPIWHPFWHLFWHFLLHSIWHSFWYAIWHHFWHSFWHSVWHSVLATKQPGICHILRHSFWHSTWYIFGYSLWLRSGGDHSDPEVFSSGPALRSRACSWGPAEEGGGKLSLGKLWRLILSTRDISIEVVSHTFQTKPFTSSNCRHFCTSWCPLRKGKTQARHTAAEPWKLATVPRSKAGSGLRGHSWGQNLWFPEEDDLQMVGFPQS